MKKIYLYITLALIFASCEKVVHIDLNEANPRIVVDAQLVDTGNGLGNAIIKLSWSGSFYDDNNFKPIENASIKISDPRGKIYHFTEVKAGEYINTQMEAVYIDDEFNLEIETNNETLSAKSSLPRYVPIDSLSFAPFVFGPHRGNGFVVHCHFMDPPNEENFYYLKLIINDTVSSDYFIGSDDAIDGEQIDYVFFKHAIEKGAFVVVELYTIDEMAYDYFRVLKKDENSGGMSAAPGNPISNIKGNAIGIFRASAKDEKYIIVPPFSI